MIGIFKQDSICVLNVPQSIVSVQVEFVAKNTEIHHVGWLYQVIYCTAPFIHGSQATRADIPCLSVRQTSPFSIYQVAWPVSAILAILAIPRRYEPYTIMEWGLRREWAFLARYAISMEILGQGRAPPGSTPRARSSRWRVERVRNHLLSTWLASSSHIISG